MLIYEKLTNNFIKLVLYIIHGSLFEKKTRSIYHGN